MKSTITTKYAQLILTLLFACLVNMSVNAQQFLGVTSYGSTGTGGTLYTIPYSGSGYSSVYNFTVDYPGSSPLYVKPCLSPTGKIFGTTNTGGMYNLGTIWSYDPTANTYTVVKDLNTADGTGPYAGLFLASDGNMYGMTRLGGTNAQGTIFKFNEGTGTYTKLYDFVSASGGRPRGRFMQGTNGLLYAMTYEGGANAVGVLFSFDITSNTYTKLYDMTSANGSYSWGSLVEHLGSLYGVTSSGGANNVGVIFQWNISTATYTLKHSFVTSTEGANPYGGMVKATNSKLYGLTNNGGTNGLGTIFEYTTSTNIFVNKVNLTGATGYYPTGEFEQATSGTWYVVMSSGGSGYGMVTSYVTAATSVSSCFYMTITTGKAPLGSLVQHTNGKMYGISSQGGGNTTTVDYQVGDIYEFDPSTNACIQKKIFEYSVNGKYSEASTLILATNNFYYGTTKYGGVNNYGVLYKFDLGTGIYTKLYDFTQSNGSHPIGPLMQATDGNLYGTTYDGGTQAYGVLFRYNITTNVYTKLFDFSSGYGNPCGGVMQASTGKLYGNCYTYFFSYDISSSTLTPITSMSGSNPITGVPVEGNNTTIFGVTYYGGIGYGRIWSYNTTTTTFQYIYNLSLANGASGACTMIIGGTGNLFGVTTQGGANGFGSFFEYNYITNTFYNRNSFTTGTIATGQFNSLLLANDGNIYGACRTGGSNNEGMMYKWDYSTYTTQYSFSRLTGGFPTGGFIEVSCVAPNQPGTISGNTAICQGSNNTYSISAVPGATSYTWLLPSGWGGSSTTTSISTTASATSGNISVTANNTCGGSTPRTLAVTVSPVPAQPGTITGSATVCSGSNNTYSISAVSGATSYTWVLPGGWTGSSTTTSINTTASSTSGSVTVTANNACGSSTPQTLAVTVSPVPATPGAISGNTTVCQTSSNTYSISAVSGATSYTWVLPGGWTGSSTTTSINATASGTSGNITVTANNACGSSSPQTLAVTVTPTPAQPGAISGNTTVCQTSLNTYSISAVSGATSYTWVLPGGWTGSSTTTSINATASGTSGNITVTANNVCGSSTPQTLAVTVSPTPATPGAISGNVTICANSNNTYSISAVSGATSYTWVLPSGWTGSSTTTSISTTASSTSGNVTVTANNTCGSSSPQTLAVTVSPVPATPGAISGNVTVCQNSNNTYSISAVSGATSYTWVLPGGWTGSSTTTSISTTASATSGNITVTANNACGSSSPQTLAVTVSPAPAQPGSITGNTTVCQGSTNTYIISPVSGATSYTWVLPGGWTGTSTTTSIAATASSTSGNITVTANNACGSSSPQTLTVTVVPFPATPGAISGPTVLCQNATNTYSIAPVSGATSYTWVLPSGWTGSSVTTSISATASATSGSISVTADNSCGSSAPQTIAVIVNPLPNVTLSAQFASRCTTQINDALTGTPPGGTYSGPGVTGNNFDASVAGVGVHTLTYTFTNINGCTNSATTQVSVSLCTGIQTIDENSMFNVYPNPFNDNLTVRCDNLSGTAVAEIFNMLGEKIITQQITNAISEVDMTKLESGVYFIKLTTGEGSATKKIVKSN